MAGISGISAVDRSYIPLSGTPAGGGRDFASVLERARKEGDPLSPQGKDDPQFDRALYEQCEALETFLVKNMLSQMRKTVIKTNLIDTGFAGEVYEDMLWDEYAKEYTRKADFGFAELAYRELRGKRGGFEI
ncbi:MAG: rod-binding protein [Treponema sp.]|jgi:flagellar protein FlgJ|nr:rod-binding protein [Treponema sp.]